MSQLDIVKSLLLNLRKEEIRSLRRYLQLFEEGNGANQLKSLSLLELILNGKNYPEEKICKKLYGDHSEPTLKTFNKMLTRFKEKVYELLILDINLFRKDSHDELNMAVSEVRKLLLQINVLERIAPVQEVLRLYDKVKQVAKNFELYDELLLSLSGRILFAGKYAGSGVKREIQTEIMFYDRCRHSLVKAREFYFRLVQMKTGHSITPDKLVYEQAIEELEHEYRYTKSASVGYILNDLNCHFQQAIGNFDAAEKACHRVISIVSENPAVYRDERMTRAFINLATIELLRLNFRQSESAVSRAYIYIQGKKDIDLEAGKLTFLNFFYRGQYERAVLYLNALQPDPNNDAVVEYGIFNYFRAAVNTLLGHTHEALTLLQKTNDLDKDQPAWNMGIRLLVILNLLETEKLDAVESQIENFKKYIERTDKSRINTERFSLIVKLLSSLMKESFDYSAVFEKESNNFSLLDSAIPELSWNPESPEIIIFPIWIQSRAKHLNYQQLVEEWFESRRKITHELRLFD